MSRTATLEKPDEQFIALAKSISDQCRLNAVTWEIDQARLDILSSLLATAEEAYHANGNPSTCNHATATVKKAAFAELRRFLSAFIDYLVTNTSVPDDALAAMNLRSRTRPLRQLLPEPADVPIINVTHHHYEVTVYAVRNKHAQPGVHARRYHGIKIRWRFEDETTWHTELSSRRRCTLCFGHNDKARTIILSVSWINPRLQEGPCSDEISAVIG
ncbi:MAG: hypothetical protein LBK65_00565 [Tannerellaceae bacterium]|jgi:hypothetical protein|nr:hypothetical protein [Tannerellaceae bacterium]